MDLIYVLWFKMSRHKTTKLEVTSRKTTQIPRATEKQFNWIKDFLVNDFFFNYLATSIRLLLWVCTVHMNTNFWWFHWVDTQIYKSNLLLFERFKLFLRQYLSFIFWDRKRKKEEAFIQLKTWLSRALWSMMTPCF